MAAKSALLFELLGRVTNDNAKKEYYLTDVVGLATAAGHRVTHTLIDEAEILGVNDRTDLARAEAKLQERLREATMRGGVTLIAPETVFLSADAVIESDVIIEPHVIIGKGCHIGEGTIIKAFSHLEGAKLRPAASSAPTQGFAPGQTARMG